MTSIIKLHGKNRGVGEFIVDDVDFTRCKRHVWRMRNGYPYTNIMGKPVSIQNFILEIEEGGEFIGDHIDLNPLNDTRNNLRRCTVNQNNFNRPKPKQNTSGYKGVTKRGENKFLSRIYVHGKEIRLGEFEKAEDAAVVYDMASIKYHGEFGKTNFDRSNYE